MMLLIHPPPFCSLLFHNFWLVGDLRERDVVMYYVTPPSQLFAGGALFICSSRSPVFLPTPPSLHLHSTGPPKAMSNNNNNDNHDNSNNHEPINLATVEAFAIDPALADDHTLFLPLNDQHAHLDIHGHEDNGDINININDQAGPSQHDIDAAIKATFDEHATGDGDPENDNRAFLEGLDPVDQLSSRVNLHPGPRLMGTPTPGIETPHLLRPPERDENTPHPECLEFNYRAEFEAWLQTESYWCHYVQRRVTNPEKRAAERLKARIKAHEANLQSEYTVVDADTRDGS